MGQLGGAQVRAVVLSGEGCGHASIELEDLAGQEAGMFRRKEGDGGSQFFGLARPLQGDGLDAGFQVVEVGEGWRDDGRRSDGVDRYAVRAELHGEVLQRRLDARSED
jgi:hypothetical protein